LDTTREAPGNVAQARFASFRDKILVRFGVCAPWSFLEAVHDSEYRSERLSSIPPMRLDFLSNSTFRYEMKGLTSQIMDGSASSIAVSDVNQAYNIIE